jgi:hypothetical protein
VTVASAAKPGAAGRHHKPLTVASAAKPGAAGRHHKPLTVASAAKPGAAGRHHKPQLVLPLRGNRRGGRFVVAVPAAAVGVAELAYGVFVRALERVEDRLLRVSRQ